MQNTRIQPTTPEIVYEDNHVILVIKPFNIPTQSDITGDPDLLTMVKDYLKRKYDKPGNVYLGMVHRLDRPVGGLVLFAKTSKAASRLSEQFRRNSIKKEYVAVVLGTPREKQTTLVHYLLKDKDKNKTRAYKNEQPGAKRAELSYHVTRMKGKFSLLRIQPKTGRPHQIRTQLSAVGHPIIGDVKYGAPEPLLDKNIFLYAVSLEFEHPVKKETMYFEIDQPGDWPL